MSSFALPAPRSSIAAAVPSTLFHIGLIASALWATRASAIILGHEPIPISITWTPQVPAHAASTSTMPPLPGAPVVSTPAIPDIPMTEIPRSIPWIPRVDPGTMVPGSPMGDPFPPGNDPGPTSYVFREAEVDELPIVLTAGRLRYPTVLLEAGIAGSVTLTFIIDAEGKVDPAAIEILSATHPGFVAAATETIRASRFTPAKRHGEAVRVKVRQTVIFRN